MTRRILVTDAVALAGLHPLAEHDQFELVQVDDSASERFRTELATADALIVRSATMVTRDLLGLAPRLRAVARAGVGIDNCDLPAASELGVAVFNAPGGNTNAAAELTVGLMISVARKIPAAEASLRRGEWNRSEFQGVELKGKTLALVGAGRIGSAVALRCQVFGMEVVVFDPYLSSARADEIGVELVGLEEAIERGDFVSIHVPLNAETRGMIDEEMLTLMKPTSFLINVSRGGIVDETALAKALHNGSIAGAALDVYEVEPLRTDSPLREAPNLVLSPHLGASTVEAQVGVATEVAEKIRVFLDTGSFTDAVNAADLVLPD
jgi:D-3-phosphoglycerate dehydrogenase